MPAMVGFINLVSMGSASVFTVGDVFYISPISYNTTYAGSGSFNTGDGLQIANYANQTNIDSTSQFDMPVVGNM